jgi:hypothetical protein
MKVGVASEVYALSPYGGENVVVIGNSVCSLFRSRHLFELIKRKLQLLPLL